MEPQQAGGATRPYMGNINQIRNYFPQFFCILSYWQAGSLAKSVATQVG
jgi:hypothetical protein